MARAGEAPEVVLEATYGWYWAADTLAGLGACVHLAHPLGVKAFSYRRVKNDERDAADLADLLRMGRLPEAWIAPPAIRELRELVRHRAKLVACCAATCVARSTRCWPAQGIAVPVSDLFGVSGTKLLERITLARRATRRESTRLRRLIDAFDTEIDLFTPMIARQLAARHPGYVAVQTIPGVGPVLGSVFVAEIGDITRFRGPSQLACWAGLTPKHHESDTTVHRGRITKQGSRPVRWAGDRSGPARRQVHPPRRAPRPGRRAPRPQHRQGRRRPRTDRDASTTRYAITPCAASRRQHERSSRRGRARSCIVMTPRSNGVVALLIDLARPQPPVAALHAATARRRDD